MLQIGRFLCFIVLMGQVLFLVKSLKFGGSFLILFMWFFQIFSFFGSFLNILFLLSIFILMRLYLVFFFFLIFFLKCFVMSWWLRQMLSIGMLNLLQCLRMVEQFFVLFMFGFFEKIIFFGFIVLIFLSGVVFGIIFVLMLRQ